MLVKRERRLKVEAAERALREEGARKARAELLDELVQRDIITESQRLELTAEYNNSHQN